MSLPSYLTGHDAIVLGTTGMPGTLTRSGQSPVEVTVAIRQPQSEVFQRDGGFSQQRTQVSGRGLWTDFNLAKEGDILVQDGVTYVLAHSPNHNGYGIAEFTLRISI